MSEFVFSISLTALIISTSCFAKESMISKITVLNNDFKEVKLIEDPNELFEFTKQWNSKVDLKDGTVPFGVSAKTKHYKIDVVAEGRSTRWLYLPIGRVHILTKGPASTYKIEDIEAFNKLIGAN